MAMDSTRTHMMRALYLPEAVGSQLYPGGSSQWQALKADQPVTFTQAQVKSLCPPNLRPANVDSFAAWTLTGSNTWTGS